MRKMLLFSIVLIIGTAWGQACTADDGTEGVELWGECYSIENTDSLDLSGSWDNPGELTGSIPPEIGNLTNLTYLDLSNNQLSGPIPPEIGNLTNLTILELWENNLSGEIPTELYNLTNLTELDLSSNDLTGSIPPEIGNLTNLTELNLGENQLTGEIPTELYNLTNLEDLRVDNNELGGVVPSAIGNLTSLTKLILYGNQFTGSIDNICSMSSLTYVSIASNNFTGGIDCIVDMTNLSYIQAWGNEFGGEIPSGIGNLTSLTEIDFAQCQLVGEIPSEIGNLTNLNYLWLNGNQLTSSIPSEIGTLTNLEWLYLANNQLTGAIPESICDLTLDFTDYHFNISNNQLCPPYPSCIEDYVGEQDTSNCGECDENSEVELWGQNYSVENTTIIDLNNSGLTGPIPTEIGCLSNLTTLLLQNNELSGEIPGTICSLNVDWTSSNFKIYNNQLCPPYPSCIEEYVGEQDTTNCGQVSIIDETIPIAYNLYNAYPNPFNPVTILRYDLPEDALVNITIYDMMGRVVKTMLNSQQNAGFKSVRWNATNNAGQPVSAGLYLYTIQAGDFRQTKKMVLLK